MEGVGREVEVEVAVAVAAVDLEDEGEVEEEAFRLSRYWKIKAMVAICNYKVLGEESHNVALRYC